VASPAFYVGDEVFPVTPAGYCPSGMSERHFKKNVPTPSAVSHIEDGGSRFLQNITFL